MMERRQPGRDLIVPSDRYAGLAAVLGAVRSSSDTTQPMLVEQVGLGRSVVAQRVAELEAAGLVVSDGFGPSTGGRAPRRLRLNSDAGHVLGADIATNELVAGVADLSGALLGTRHRELDVVDGPEIVVGAVEQLAAELVGEVGAHRSLWSFGVGMPGPVAYDSGGPATMPTLPDWSRHPTRERLAERFGVPVWVDNRTNLSALGERRVNPVAARSRHMIYLGGGYGLGAAVVLDGRIHRGAHGLAGGIDHVPVPGADRKSTRLNSSHANISYAVFCLKKKTRTSNPAGVTALSTTRPTSPITFLGPRVAGAALPSQPAQKAC